MVAAGRPSSMVLRLLRRDYLLNMGPVVGFGSLPAAGSLMLSRLNGRGC